MTKAATSTKRTRRSQIHERLHSHADALWAACECDGRGCVVCIAIDALREIERELSGSTQAWAVCERGIAVTSPQLPIFWRRHVAEDFLKRTLRGRGRVVKVYVTGGTNRISGEVQEAGS